jgi:vitamin-K-epoxide reductase (warfarin-sensitive)
MRYLIAILAVLGLVVSSLALHVHYSQDVEVCDINARWDCGIVNHSRYAVLGHVPVAAIGIAGYALLAGLALLRRNRFLAALSLVGLAFALYLTHIEAHVLQIWCLYCVASQIIIAAIALLSVIAVIRDPGRTASARL